MGGIGAIEILVLLLIVTPFYFLPTIIALIIKKTNQTAIFFLNLLLGWTFLGWIAALVLACTSDKVQTIVVDNSFSEPKTDKRTEEKFENIQKLKDLLDSGALTQAEFDEQKAKILSA